MKLCATLGIAVIALLGANPALAADKQGNYAARGQQGTMRCSEMAQLAKSGGSRLTAMSAWLDGILTGLNMSLAATVDISPYRGGPVFMAMVVDRCNKSPELAVHAVAHQVANALAPFRVQAPVDAVSMSANGVAMNLAQPVVELVEQMLMQLGHLRPDRPEGRYTKELRAAIKAFQHAQRLPETELPDPETLLRLHEMVAVRPQ